MLIEVLIHKDDYAKIKYIFDTILLNYEKFAVIRYNFDSTPAGDADAAVYYRPENDPPEKPNLIFVYHSNDTYDINDFTGIDPGEFIENPPGLFDGAAVPVIEATIKSGSDTFVKKGSPVNPGQFYFDIFNNIFEHLSYKFEYEHNNIEDSAAFAYAHSCGKDIAYYQIPVADLFLSCLMKEIETAASLDGKAVLSKFLYPERKEFGLALTHDVDHIDKNFIVRILRGFFILRSFLNFVTKPKMKYIRSFLKFKLIFIRRSDYLQIEKIVAGEQEHGVKSSFNVFVQESTDRFDKKLKKGEFNPSYDIRNFKKMQTALRVLPGRTEIGLHPAINSYQDVEYIRDEKETLERYTQTPVTGGRQHYLSFTNPIMWEAYRDIGFEYSTSMGFNDLNGFRSSSCRPHYPFNHSKQSAIPVLEIPMTLMDSTFTLFLMESKSDILAQSVKSLETLRYFRGLSSICWHNIAFSSDYALNEIYFDLIEWVKERSGYCGSPQEFVDYKNRLNALVLNGCERNGTVRYSFTVERDIDSIDLKLESPGPVKMTVTNGVAHKYEDGLLTLSGLRAETHFTIEINSR